MTNRFLPMLAERCLNRPLLITPAKADEIFAVLEGRILPGFDWSDDTEAATDAVTPEASRFKGTYQRQRRRGGALVPAAGKTAIVTVDGSLVNRGGWIGAYSGVTSYEGIAAQIDDAASDPEIENIVLDINSPGGEAGGMFGLASKVRDARKTKHVVAVVNDMAASAAYGIASSADQIVVSPTSMVGSIGVVMLHLDRSAELAAKGIRPTLIHAGAHKVDGHPFGPLPDDVRASMQRDTMAFYDRFLDTVAAGRGSRLTAAKARKTEAQTYIGQAAIDAGLADRMGSLDDVLAELSKRAANPAAKPPKGKKMDEQYDAGIARSARAEERRRIGAIMALPEAKGREGLAQSLAYGSDMSVEAIKASLAAAPLAAAVTSIEDRAAQQREIGAPLAAAPGTDAGKAKAGWAAATAAVNKGFTA